MTTMESRNEQFIKEVEKMCNSMVKKSKKGDMPAESVVYETRNMIFFAQALRMQVGDHIDPKDRMGGNIRRENFPAGNTKRQQAFFYTRMLRDELLQMLDRTDTNLPRHVQTIVSTVTSGLSLESKPSENKRVVRKAA